jgi:hypothetical protein
MDVFGSYPPTIQQKAAPKRKLDFVTLHPRADHSSPSALEPSRVLVRLTLATIQGEPNAGRKEKHMLNTKATSSNRWFITAAFALGIVSLGSWVLARDSDDASDNGSSGFRSNLPGMLPQEF